MTEYLLSSTCYLLVLFQGVESSDVSMRYLRYTSYLPYHNDEIDVVDKESWCQCMPILTEPNPGIVSNHPPNF